ncbi:MAG TPA: transglycosylase family protein [Solirubrobacterales bacterium]|nr:transglycosylase family protein [Solirubrobacterales bacterium]
MLTERKHIALLGALAALAAPAAASAAQHKDRKLPPRVRLRADAAAGATDASSTGANAIGNAVAVDGPLLDPVDRYSRLIAATTERTVHRREVHARERRETREEKQQAREEEEQFAQLPGGVSMETLEAIAACESGGNPEAVSPDGTYMGLFQFDQGTWESVGGTGSPTEAPAAEQDYRAALLYSESGSSPWPVCG